MRRLTFAIGRITDILNNGERNTLSYMRWKQTGGTYSNEQ